MSAALFLLVAFGIGFGTGLRTFTPLAFICWIAVWGWVPLGSSRLAFLGTEIGAIIVSVLAGIELIADKLPMTPARTTAGPLGARILIALFATAALAIGMGQSLAGAMLIGAAGSVAGAFAGFGYRRAVNRLTKLPDFIFAIVEDFLTVALTLGALRLLFGD